MKKHILIELVLVSIIFGFCFWNVNRQQENIDLLRTIENLREKQKEQKVVLEILKDENENLSNELDKFYASLKNKEQITTITDTDDNICVEYDLVVKKVFEGNLNFTPDDIENKKKEVSSYLSDELNTEYFGQERKTYQDANDTFSELVWLEVYQKGIENNKVEGVVVVYHRNKKIGLSWKSGMNLFKVAYNTETKKIVEILNLGNSFIGIKIKQ